MKSFSRRHNSYLKSQKKCAKIYCRTVAWKGCFKMNKKKPMIMRIAILALVAVMILGMIIGAVLR